MDSLALVDAWEDGRLRNRIERPLVLLAAFQPDAREDWASLPIGKRDSRLLGLREELFGTSLSAFANCPECAETLEVSFLTRDIRVDEPSEGGASLEVSRTLGGASGYTASPYRRLGDDELQASRNVGTNPPTATTCGEPEGGETLRVDVDGYIVRFRLPNTADLKFVSRTSPDSDPRSLLLQRCVTDSTSAVADLPTSVVEAIVERMGDADPQAVVELSLQCPACGYAWALPFDIAAYLWGEVEDLVYRLFGEVHTLATAYGWAEREILAMSPLRRRIYLDMVEG